MACASHAFIPLRQWQWWVRLPNASNRHLQGVHIAIRWPVLPVARNDSLPCAIVWILFAHQKTERIMSSTDAHAQIAYNQLVIDHVVAQPASGKPVQSVRIVTIRQNVCQV